jgi:hypothetical protein
MGILPYMHRILKEGIHVLHPKEELGILADTERVKYIVDLEKRRDKDESRTDEGPEFLCKIEIGEGERRRGVVSVGGGVGKDEIMTKAAEEAVRILKAPKEEENKRKKIRRG